MIIYYSVLFVSFFIIAFFIRSFRKVFQNLAINSVALVNELIATNDDDDELIQEIQRSTNRLVVSLFTMLLVLVVAFVLGSIPVIAYSFIENISWDQLVFSSFYSILAISMGATVPFILPYKKKDSSSYSELSKLFHRMALDNYNISNKLFKIESRKFNKRGISVRNDFVIISGLARAGTTSLMNKLSDFPEFVSLSYANMPFLMSPNIWKRYYNPKTKILKERSHKDGIMIGFNSIEALEEYFFKVKADDSYILENSLNQYSIPEEHYRDYLNYQRNITADESKIYLAKNNNFILRYKSVREFNDDFLMVILYRDPLTHAASLLEKHQDYIVLQSDDEFVQEYMNWLGHHEFGLSQKQFLFEGDSLIEGDKESLDYWLKIWINYYSYVLNIDHPKTYFINYDDFCSSPEKVIERLLSGINLKVDIPEYTSFTNKRKSAENYNKDLYLKAMEIHNKLLDK